MEKLEKQAIELLQMMCGRDVYKRQHERCDFQDDHRPRRELCGHLYFF